MKNVDGVSLLFKLELNEFHVCKLYCQLFNMDNYFQENIKIKSPINLSCSSIVGEAFLKTLRIHI